MLTLAEKGLNLLYILPFIAFYLGTMWVRVGNELEEEEVK